MQYSLTPIEIQEVSKAFNVPECFMRLMLNHINSINSDIECSLYAEIDWCLRHPETIVLTNHTDVPKNS